MFCQKCGEKNKDNVKFCEHCGASFIGKSTPKKTATTRISEQKSPIVACLLNLLLLGAGFMYLGQVGRGFKYLIIGLLLSWTIITPIIMLIMSMVKSYELANLINSGKVEIITGKIITK